MYTALAPTTHCPITLPPLLAASPFLPNSTSGRFRRLVPTPTSVTPTKSTVSTLLQITLQNLLHNIEKNMSSETIQEQGRGSLESKEGKATMQAEHKEGAEGRVKTQAEANVDCRRRGNITSSLLRIKTTFADHLRSTHFAYWISRQSFGAASAVSQ